MSPVKSAKEILARSGVPDGEPIKEREVARDGRTPAACEEPRSLRNDRHRPIHERRDDPTSPRGVAAGRTRCWGARVAAGGGPGRYGSNGPAAHYFRAAGFGREGRRTHMSDATEDLQGTAPTPDAEPTADEAPEAEQAEDAEATGEESDADALDAQAPQEE